MRKIYSFLAAVALMCVSTIASAAEPHVANITSDPENIYFSGSQSFDINEIVTELGLADEAALASLINNGGAVYIAYNGVTSNAYTGGANEFWMNVDGVPQGYGDSGSCWYAGLYYDPAGTDPDTNEPYESEFYTKVGQMPNFFKTIYTDSELSCVLYLVNGDATATFNINLKVNAAEETGDVFLSQLDIVKDYTLTLDFTEGKSYEGKTYTTTLEGIYDALGTTAEEFDSKVASKTYAQTALGTYNEAIDDTEYALTDTLKLPEDAAGGGWFGRYLNYDEATDKEIALAINAPKAWGSTPNTFYVQSITLANGEFSIASGQYPNILKAGDNDSTYLYIVNDTKAARVKVQVEVTAPAYIDPSEWTAVGDTTLIQTATKVIPYWGISTPLENIASIAAALEIEDPQDITFYHLPTSGEGFMDDLSDGWGAWLNADGNFCSWGTDARVMVAYELEDGVYQISTLQMDGTVNNGDAFNFPVYLANPAAGKYYTINFKYNIDVQAVDPSEWSQEYATSYNVQLVLAEGYGQDASSQTTLDMAAIAEAIGTDDPTLYGESWDGDNLTYSTAYSCDPNPGFWMATDGKSVGTWGANPAYGMTYANGVITYYARNDIGLASGATYEGVFYLVNDENGKYAKITLDIEYVDERGAQVDAVGETNVTITLAESTFDGDFYQGSEGVVWSDVYTALGITEDDIEDCTWMVQNQSGKLVSFGNSAAFWGEEAGMDRNGYYVDVNNGGNSDNIVFGMGYNTETKKFNFSLMGEEPADGVLYKTKIGLKSDSGYYVFNITAASETTITGISNVKAQQKAGKVYDINGREVSAPVKGIYVIDGQKVYVK